MGAQQLEGGSLQKWGGSGTAPLLLLPLPDSLLSPALCYLPLQHTWGCDIPWDMIESKDLLFACYSGKTPTGISEPLNSTACCKWNCLLCAVRAGYSQLSLLTQLHEISPSCHPTLHSSLGPALFPLKCWKKMVSGLLHHLLLLLLNLGTVEEQRESLKDEDSRSDLVLVQKAVWSPEPRICFPSSSPLWKPAHQNHASQGEYQH